MNKVAIMAMALAAFTFSAPSAFAEGEKGRGKGKMFQEADQNADGAISKDEFKAHHEKKAEDWFNKLDQDGSGSVTAEEAQEGRKKMRENMKARMEERKAKRQQQKQKPNAAVPTTDAPGAGADIGADGGDAASPVGE